MIQSNRVTIIVEDGAVYLDQYAYAGLDFSSCDIPNGVHALQWLNGSGQIEFKSNWVLNEEITALPTWALACIEKWEEAYQLNPPE